MKNNLEVLKKKLINLENETDWLAIMREVPMPERQIQIRAEIGRAIKRIDRELAS